MWLVLHRLVPSPLMSMVSTLGTIMRTPPARPEPPTIFETQVARSLLDVVEIKGLARQAGLQQVDAGPKGAVIAFRKNQFANPEGLVLFMQKSRGGIRMQPDHKLVFKADWDLPEIRLKGVRTLVRQLAEIATAGKKAA